MTLWTATEIAAATGGAASEDFTIESLSIDTRSLQPAALFVPLKDVRDGHDFIPNAMQSGAAGTLSDHPVEAPHILVKDTLVALQDMAKASAKRSQAKRIAVTGSVGKTSVKDALAVMFAKFGQTHKSIKSFNNHWGVPLTLAGMPKETAFGVFEMGMNNPGEIATLSTLVEPDIAVITTVAAAHLAHFNSVKDIADAKAEIIAGLGDEGVLILNGDNEFTPYIREKAQGKTVITFGYGDDNDVVIVTSQSSQYGVNVRLRIGLQQIDVLINIPGDHWVSNAACCMAVALAANIDLRKAARALQRVQPAPGRGDVSQLSIHGKSVTLVDESYNANPTSMRSALSALANRPGRRLAVLGDMYELGADEISLHAALAEPILAADVARVIVTGECMRALRGALPQAKRGAWANDANEAYEALLHELQDGDVVMIKGSNATGLGTLTARLKRDFANVI